MLQAQANAAQSQYLVATADVGQAAAQLDGMAMGATPEQIAAAEARLGVSR